MKASDFIANLAKLAGVEDVNLSESLGEAEISEDLVGSIQGAILTRDAAKNDGAIKDHFNNLLQAKINEPLKNLLKSEVGDNEELKNVVYADANDTAVKRLNALLAHTKNQKSKPAASDTKLQKEVDRLNGEIRTMQENHSTAVKELKTGFNNERITDKVRATILKQNLVDNIPGGKDYLTSAASSKLRDKYALVLNEGKVEVRTKENPELLVYEQNEPLTLEGAIKGEIKDFIKKSNDPRNNPNPSNPKPVNKPDVDRSKMDVHQATRASGYTSAI